MPYSCSFSGKCEQNPFGLYATRQECQRQCQGRDAKEVNYLIYEYAISELLELAPTDQIEIIKRLYSTDLSLVELQELHQALASPEDIDTFNTWLHHPTIISAIKKEGLIPLISLLYSPHKSLLLSPSALKLVEEFNLHFVYFILQEPDAVSLVKNLASASNSLEKASLLQGREAFLYQPRFPDQSHLLWVPKGILTQDQINLIDEGEDIPPDILKAIISQHLDLSQIQRGDVVKIPDLGVEPRHNLEFVIYDGTDFQPLEYDWNDYGVVPREMPINLFPRTDYFHPSIPHSVSVYLETEDLDVPHLIVEDYDDNLSLITVGGYKIIVGDLEEVLENLRKEETVILLSAFPGVLVKLREDLIDHPKILYDSL